MKLRRTINTVCLLSLLIISSQASAQAPRYGDSLITIDQGWGKEDRDIFYHSPQGSPIIIYDWFLALEQANSNRLFIEDDYLASFGLIKSSRSKRNPDGLPIGFTKDLGIDGIESKLGINCGACHVSEITYKEKNVLIDGGTAQFDFWKFMTSLNRSLEKTYNDHEKFKRFSKRVLGSKLNDLEKDKLKSRFRSVLTKRQEWENLNATNVIPGPSRVDALNIILNQVTAKMLDRPDNARPANAPVSLPYLWDAAYLEYVQYNGAVPNRGLGSISRNVGQVLGVFGEVSLISGTIPPGYPSSVRVDHLIQLEETMKILTSPSWSELADKGVLPQLNQQRLKRGRNIYSKQCADCHAIINPKDRGELASIPIKRMSYRTIGTDPETTFAFTKREVATGPLYGRKVNYLDGQKLCKKAHADQILAHITIGVMMHDLHDTGLPVAKQLAKKTLKNTYKNITQFLSAVSHGDKKKQETIQHVILRMNNEGASKHEIVRALKEKSNDESALFDLLVEDGINRDEADRPCLEKLEHARYRARPLNGIWATGPFLHNGSVRTLRDLLEKPEARPNTFYVGSTEIDVKSVGFANIKTDRSMKLDTSVKGNRNTGHNYGTSLSSKDKRDLIEYLKSL